MSNRENIAQNLFRVLRDGVETTVDGWSVTVADIDLMPTEHVRSWVMWNDSNADVQPEDFTGMSVGEQDSALREMAREMIQGAAPLSAIQP
jgi:hypothetical protein